MPGSTKAGARPVKDVCRSNNKAQVVDTVGRDLRGTEDERSLNVLAISRCICDDHEPVENQVTTRGVSTRSRRVNVLCEGQEIKQEVNSRDRI